MLRSSLSLLNELMLTMFMVFLLSGCVSLNSSTSPGLVVIHLSLGQYFISSFYKKDTTKSYYLIFVLNFAEDIPPPPCWSCYCVVLGNLSTPPPLFISGYVIAVGELRIPDFSRLFYDERRRNAAVGVHLTFQFD